MRNNSNTYSSNHTYNGNAILRRDVNSPRVPSPFGLVGRTDLFPGGIDPFSVAATLRTTSPFYLMRRMQDDMDRLFSQAFPELGSIASSWATPGDNTNISNIANFAPSVDVSETDTDYRIEMELPGVSQDAVDIHVVEGMLTVRAEIQSRQDAGDGQKETTPREATERSQQQERRYHYRERRWGRFERAFSLPANADEDNIRADFQDGVLTLTISKKPTQEERRGRRIVIASSENAGQEPQRIEAKEPAAASHSE